MSEEKKEGFFAPEKKGIQKGMLGGIAMIAIAVVWFFLGYAAGYIFYYPPILFLIGLYALIKGMITGNIRGEKAAIEESAEPVSKTDYSELFNLERDGINYYVGGAYILADLIMTVVAGFIWSPAPAEYYYYIFLPTTIIEAALFLAVSYLVQKTTLLPLVFGAGICLLSLLRRYLIVSMKIDEYNLEVIDWWSLINSFLYGIFFLSGILLAIRNWGLQNWSIMLGLGIAFIINSVITTIEFSIRFEYLATDWQNWVYDISSAVITGWLLYAGLQIFFRKKSELQGLPGSNYENTI